MLGWIAWDALSFGSDACLDFSLPCRMNTRSLLSAWAALLVVTVRHRGQYCSQKTSPWSDGTQQQTQCFPGSGGVGEWVSTGTNYAVVIECTAAMDLLPAQMALASLGAVNQG